MNFYKNLAEILEYKKIILVYQALKVKSLIKFSISIWGGGVYDTTIDPLEKNTK